jgi:hypothetical protein
MHGGAAHHGIQFGGGTPLDRYGLVDGVGGCRKDHVTDACRDDRDATAQNHIHGAPSVAIVIVHTHLAYVLPTFSA